MTKRLTNRQYETLAWLVSIGGVCECRGDKLIRPGDKLGPGQPMGATYGRMPALCAIHLVQIGAIEASCGLLHITDYGRRLLEP